jgi:hypothetical protein
MDDLEGTDDRSFHPPNEYPDLDMTPNYLWVGKADPTLCNSNPFSSGRFPQPRAAIEHDDLEKEVFDGRDRFRGLDATASEDNEDNGWRQAAGNVDPDFELREDDSTQVSSFSWLMAYC